MKVDDRSDRERLRDEHKFMRERAKEAAKWAALHPTDDLEVACPSLPSAGSSCAVLEHKSACPEHHADSCAARATGSVEDEAAIGTASNSCYKLHVHCCERYLVLDAQHCRRTSAHLNWSACDRNVITCMR